MKDQIKTYLTGRFPIMSTFKAESLSEGIQQELKGTTGVSERNEKISKYLMKQIPGFSQSLTDDISEGMTKEINFDTPAEPTAEDYSKIFNDDAERDKAGTVDLGLKDEG